MKKIPQDKLAEWALENLNRCYIKVAPSKVHGVGVIAIRDIPKDTVIFSFSYNDSPCVEIKKSLLKQRIPKEVYSQLIKNWAETAETVLVPLNINHQLHFVNFLNHSKEANIRYEKEKYISTRRILKDEEIFIDFKEEDYNPDGIRF